ncbi:MAG TPA: hypothetical protein VNE58_17695, partial [Casimicrobiaceae bacterium]|nr:hypothetical protein [Casimicrobiaceae bacterium]
VCQRSIRSSFRRDGASTAVPMRQGRGIRAAAKGVDPPICYCRDCRAYAFHIGDAEAVLDAHGGTDVVATQASQVELTAIDQLARLSLSPKGLVALVRGVLQYADREHGARLAARV